VFRKLTGQTGEFADCFFGEWQQKLKELRGDDNLLVFVEPAAESLSLLVDATAWIRVNIQTEPGAASGAASNYLRLFALSIIACIWVDIIASVRTQKGDFFAVKRKTALFYMQHVVPETVALHAVIKNSSESLANFEVDEL